MMAIPGNVHSGNNGDVPPAIPVNIHVLLDWKPPSKSSLSARRSRSCTTSSSRILRILGRPRMPFHHGISPHGVDDITGDVRASSSAVLVLGSRMLCNVQSVDDVAVAGRRF